MNIENIIYALLSGILPALIWLWFWLKEDNLHPEPRRLIAITFICGGIVVLLAIFFEQIVANNVTADVNRYILWAGIEEVLKFIVVTAVFARSKNIDEPIDAMIYFITIALGFAAVENTLFILSPFSSGEIAKGIITGNMRFIGATLVHVVSSASIGFMIAISYYRNVFFKAIALFLGLILSITLHAAFNLTIINTTGANTLKVFAWVWCAVVILIVLFEEVKGMKPKSTFGGTY